VNPTVSLSSGVDRLCFCLNLYHLMVAHAQLVFGTADNFIALAKAMNRACYQIGPDVVSIAEMEHGVLRANMAPPDQLGAALLIPRGAPYTLRLRVMDCRLSFALTCGSLSTPCAVPVYRPHTVHRQLDAACRRALNPDAGGGGLSPPSRDAMLSAGVILNPKRGTVHLPKVMQWYREDFDQSGGGGGGGFGSASTSSLALLAFVRQHLPPPQQKVLDAMLNGNSAGHKKVKVKFLDYSGACRDLQLLSGDYADLEF